MKTKERSRTMTAFNEYRTRLSWAYDRPEIWREGTQWYDNATGRIQSVADETDVSLYRLAGAVSILSPQTPWERNLRGGIELARSYTERAPHWFLLEIAERSTVYNNNAKRAVKYITGNDLARPTGPKTGPFHENLAGNLDPVTVDSWMYSRILNRFGLASKSPTENAQRAVTRAVEMCSTLFGIAPARAQSVIWTVERDYWNEETANRADS